MLKTTHVCDMCKIEVSDSGRFVGWISLNLRNITISVANINSPNLPAWRMVQMEDDVEFCSLDCLKKFLDEKCRT